MGVEIEPWKAEAEDEIYKERATAANKIILSSHQHEEKHQLYIKQSVNEQKTSTCLPPTKPSFSSPAVRKHLLTSYFLPHTFLPPPTLFASLP